MTVWAHDLARAIFEWFMAGSSQRVDRHMFYNPQLNHDTVDLLRCIWNCLLIKCLPGGAQSRCDSIGRHIQVPTYLNKDKTSRTSGG